MTSHPTLTSILDMPLQPNKKADNSERNKLLVHQNRFILTVTYTNTCAQPLYKPSNFNSVEICFFWVSDPDYMQGTLKLVRFEA